MPTGYRIIQPNGVQKKQQYDDDAGREEDVKKLIARWGEYCDSNWLNDKGDLFSPERKVKLFQDGLAYYFLMGRAEDTVTEYKDIVNGAREFPVSSCPSSVANIFYASGSVPNDMDTEEKAGFMVMASLMAERAEARTAKRKPPVERSVPKWKRLRNIREENGGAEFRYYIVDTEGYFWIGQDRYHICDLPAYQSTPTRYGDLYDMDRVIVCGGRYYDMDGNEISEHVHAVGGVVPYGEQVFPTFGVCKAAQGKEQTDAAAAAPHVSV